MTAPAITLEVLPAGYGDCLLVGCPLGRRTWRLLVDTGPDETYPALRARLGQLPVGARGTRRIDLFVVSHIDHDHIGGAAQLLDDEALQLEFGDIWFNAPPPPGTRGVAEGQRLAALLGARAAGAAALPSNRAVGGGPVCTSGSGAARAMPTPAGAPRLTLLSPTPERLQALFEGWDRELARLRAGRRNEPGRARTDVACGTPDVAALAARSTPLDRTAPNGSSIAVLLEHQGASVLLAADAFATVLAPALSRLAEARGQGRALPVDVVKLSHHGSSRNVTPALLATLGSRQFVFSTNGAIFGHPDDEAVARAILAGGPGATLWFNYRTDRTLPWADPALARRYGYAARLPGDGSAGLGIEIPRRRGRFSAAAPGAMPPVTAPSSA